MFEILKTEPFAPVSVLEDKIHAYFGDGTPEYRKEFELLTSKNFHDQYYKFGDINQGLKENDVDERFGTNLATYLLFVLVSLVFLGDELSSSKRIWFIFTILTCIYEGGLFHNIQERDIFLDIFPKAYWLFDMIKYLHWLYVFVFTYLAGMGAIFSNYSDSCSENQKNELLREVKINSNTISELIDNINTLRGVDQQPDSPNNHINGDIQK